MGIYRTVSNKVEDLFVRILTKNQDAATVEEKVKQYRAQKMKKLRNLEKLNDIK